MVVIQEISDDGTEPQPTSRPPLEKQQHIDMDDINIQADEVQFKHRQE